MGERVKLRLHLQLLPMAHIIAELHFLLDPWCHNKCDALESPRNHQPTFCGKIIFRETGPWCQKAGELLL